MLLRFYLVNTEFDFIHIYQQSWAKFQAAKCDIYFPLQIDILHSLKKCQGSKIRADIDFFESTTWLVNQFQFSKYLPWSSLTVIHHKSLFLLFWTNVSKVKWHFLTLEDELLFTHVAYLNIIKHQQWDRRKLWFQAQTKLYSKKFGNVSIIIPFSIQAVKRSFIKAPGLSKIQCLRCHHTPGFWQRWDDLSLPTLYTGTLVNDPFLYQL